MQWKFVGGIEKLPSEMKISKKYVNHFDMQIKWLLFFSLRLTSGYYKHVYIISFYCNFKTSKHSFHFLICYKLKKLEQIGQKIEWEDCRCVFYVKGSYLWLPFDVFIPLPLCWN